MNLVTISARNAGSRPIALAVLLAITLPLATVLLAGSASSPASGKSTASAASTSASTSTTASAASASATTGTTAAPGVFVFNHKAHIERGTACADCHDATKERAGLMPSTENCMNCHDADKAKPAAPECLKCHTMSGGKLVGPKWTVAPELKGVRFKHPTHTVTAKLECKTCHKGIEENEKLTPDILPKMQLCIDCHSKRGAAAISCSKCHTSEIKAVRPQFHNQGNWLKLHGQEVRRGHARPMQKQCTFCHQQAFCSTCHQDTPPASHTNEFRVRGHGVMASIDRDKCLVCHRQDACVRCHQTTPPSTGPNAHRAGWESTRHCIACHIAGNTCTVCHKIAAGTHVPPGPPLPPPAVVPAHGTATLRSQCTLCHRPGQGLSHPDTGLECLTCHRR
ncbi:MAG: hypothetical protein HY303_10715 [Candidatus Wallbacteria bacterium]|nr:hypothetical protein [Candidatus Wallbacteria bacterium]